MSCDACMNPPKTGEGLAFVLFIVNCFFPGIGTLIIGFLECSCWTLLVGLMQLATACIIIGWIWSIVWGYNLYKKAHEYPDPDN